VTTAQAKAALHHHFFPDRLHVIAGRDIDKLPEY